MDEFEKWDEATDYKQFVSPYAVAKAAFKAGREAGMREAAANLKERDERAYQDIKDFAEQEKVSMSENEYLLGRGDEAHVAYMAILSAIGGGK